jgi:hypothetical protein
MNGLAEECEPPVGPGAMGTACAEDTDCNDDLCLYGYCSGPCVDDTNCAAGGTCNSESITVGGFTGIYDVCVTCAVTGLNVTPTALQTITVTAGTMTPTVTFDAVLDCAPGDVAWSVDLGNVATIAAGPSTTGVLVPTGAAGGLVTVTADYNGTTVTRQVFIKLVASQNGPTSGETGQIPTAPGQITAGGGVGGVGGTGLGTPVTNPGTVTVLNNPTGTAASVGLAFLYPYNKTVWPRGMLAPLIMWTWAPPGGPAAPGTADAIELQLNTTSGSFSWKGTFGPPAILTTLGGNFINMPIPQDIWTMATNTAGGTDQLTLSLTVAKAGVGYGPISQTWTIAEANLAGTIYYQSYGTQLVQNYSGALGGNGDFGGAILSIQPGATAPTVAAGTSAMTTGCRVCHSVGAAGSMLVVQHGDSYGTSSAYTLATTGNTEHVMTHDAAPNGNFPPAMYADGSLALSSSGVLLPLPTDTTPITTTGLPLSGGAVNLGQPAFSPDGTKVVFNPSTSSLTNNQTLYVMAFNKATMAFSGATLVATDVGQATQVKPGWPAFFPDSNSVVYHQQVVTGIENDLGTRAGSQAEIYWTSVTSSAAVTPLANLNGVGYLPKLPAKSTLSCLADGYQVGAGAAGSSGIITDPNLDHSQDTTMNYEPTVNPIASGGYVWVVFTSRRMYGNVATIPPYCSDPRGVNLAPNTTNELLTNITTKKLWVAAVSINQAAGTDSSFPAFYLPGQELIAGNSRGFWSLSPCEANGASCTVGDECCGGYCEPNAMGDLVCASTSTTNCSAVGSKCTTVSNCCDPSNLCINGFCTQN